MRYFRDTNDLDDADMLYAYGDRILVATPLLVDRNKERVIERPDSPNDLMEAQILSHPEHLPGSYIQGTERGMVELALARRGTFVHLYDGFYVVRASSVLATRQVTVE